MLPPTRIAIALFVVVLVAMGSLAAHAQEGEQAAAVTPLRLSYFNGPVSFWRYGAEDWVEASVNTPLAVGDALYVGKDAELELQAGSRAFIRADDDTEVSLVNQSADFLQIKITSGRVSFDLRTLPDPGYVVEVDTPNAVYTIDHTGYYRVDVDGDVHFITRRGGRAVMTPAGGAAMSIQPSEEIVVQGSDVALAETYVAPQLDSWDRWNDDRTNDLSDAVSERYLPSGIAGASDLDHYGSWRVVPEYGPVWVPDALPAGWVPYSTGRWVWDPYYQWTWIDDAPWAWAPYHYGRWVSLGGYWAWAPGSVAVARPAYAPALVAFFGVAPQISVGIGSSEVGWVALSWGEPVIPWWGRPGFIGRPWWGGWGGPRVVNNVAVKQTTVINVANIRYANARLANALLAVSADRFGRRQMREALQHLHVPDKDLTQMRGALPVKPNAESLVAGAPKGVRPPEQMLSRRVVATRRPPEARLPWRSEVTRPVVKAAEPRYVPAPNRSATALRRPEFGAQTGPERERAPLPPPFEERRHLVAPVTPPAAVREQREVGRSEPKPARVAPPAAASQPREVREAAIPRATQGRTTPDRQPQAARKVETSAQQARPKERAEADRRELPGKAANRTYKGRDQDKSERRRSQPAGQ